MTTYAISLRQPAYMPGFGDACPLVSGLLAHQD